MIKKIKYIATILACLFGVTLFTYSMTEKAKLDQAIVDFKAQTKTLDQTLEDNKDMVVIGLLDTYEEQIDVDLDESKRIGDFYKRYSDNLNTFFDIDGKLEGVPWGKDAYGNPIPTPSVYRSVYHNKLKQLSKRYERNLLPQEEGDVDTWAGVSKTFTRRGGISQLDTWKHTPPKPNQIHKSMLQINIAELLLQGSIAKIRIDTKNRHPILRGLEVDKPRPNSRNKTDFDHLNVKATFEIAHAQIPVLLKSILNNDELFFQVEGFEMIGGAKDDEEKKLSVPLVIVEMKVLDLKKAVYKYRTAKVDDKGNPLVARTINKRVFKAEHSDQ